MKVSTSVPKRSTSTSSFGRARLEATVRSPESGATARLGGGARHESAARNASAGLQQRHLTRLKIARHYRQTTRALTARRQVCAARRLGGRDVAARNQQQEHEEHPHCTCTSAE